LDAAMPWSDVQVGDLVKEALCRLVRSGRLAGTFLFYGPPGSALEELAFAFASAILCERKVGQASAPVANCQAETPGLLDKLVGQTSDRSQAETPGLPGHANGDFCGVCRTCRHIRERIHPDVFALEPEGAFYKIDTLRTMQGMAALLPLEAERKIFILRQADRMRQEAANSLLKVLEEPSPHSIFILLTDNVTGILPTILSRSQRVRLSPPPLDRLIENLMASKGISKEAAESLARLAGGQPGRAEEMSEGTWMERRDQLIALLEKVRHGSRLEIMHGSQVLSRDRAGARETLEALLSLIRDGLALTLLDNPAFLLNIDRRKEISSLWHGAESDQVIRAFETTVDALADLDRNLNVQNVLETVFMACAGRSSAESMSPKGPQRA
jgi:DNA polymerase-3 subunit delta'